MIPLLRYACGRVWNYIANIAAAVSKESLPLTDSVVGQDVLSACICVHTVNACVTRSPMTLKTFFSCPSVVPLVPLASLATSPYVHTKGGGCAI